MTTHERMTRVCQHRQPDRVPITDCVWESTLARWHREGLAEQDWARKLGWDLIVGIPLDTSPRFEHELIEETDTYKIERDFWGVTKKDFKPVSATFEHIDHAVRDPKTWQNAKCRMNPTRDRINWQVLEGHYRTWRDQGAWIKVAPWFGYDVVSTRMCGSETILYAMADDPDWVKDMCDTGCELALALLEMLWQAGYEFDELMWFDDMAYRNGLMFSKDMWKDIVRPYQKRTIDWAHAHGINAHLHSCGNMSELIPELRELGLDMLNPLEVKAGMDPAGLKKLYGRELILQGGFDIRNWSDPGRAEQDIRTLLPVMMDSGGYVFSSDHSIADDISLENYRHVVRVAKKVGRYEK
ncbi:MAG: uroporphyrinogen decarboxylase family protein [Planctomycetota bacterium]|jgi:uroporphyrinogen decarboxylase